MLKLLKINDINGYDFHNRYSYTKSILKEKKLFNKYIISTLSPFNKIYENNFYDKIIKMGFNIDSLNKNFNHKIIKSHVYDLPNIFSYNNIKDQYIVNFLGNLLHKFEDIYYESLNYNNKLSHYYYDDNTDLIFNSIGFICHNYTTLETLIITNKFKIYGNNHSIYMDTYSENIYIFQNKDELKITNYDTVKNKVYIKGHFTKDMISSTVYKRHYNETIIQYLNKKKDITFTVYYPKDPEYTSNTLVVKENINDKTSTSSIITNNKKEIMFQSKDDNILINKMENLQLLNRKKPIYGYKTCKLINGTQCIVKLFIPNDAVIVQPYPVDGQIIQQHKFRCDRAIVVEIQDMNGNKLEETRAYSCVHTKMLEYSIGKEIYPDGITEDRLITCGKGIHFHIDTKYCDYWKPKNDLKVTFENSDIEIADDYINEIPNNSYTFLSSPGVQSNIKRKEKTD